MTNNTPIYWEAEPVGGSPISLHTYAWSIDTFGGRRYTPPEKRGDDFVLPYRRGQKTMKKFRDSQVLDLSMWCRGRNQDGSIDNSKTTEQKFHENWQTLLEALDTEVPFKLTKRFWQGTTAKAVAGYAELMGDMEPSMIAQDAARFNIELLMADPYFYDPISSQAIGTITVQGTSPTDHIVVTFTNGTNPRITFPGNNWVQYNGTVGGNVVIDMYAGTAKVGSTYVNGLISRNQNFGEWPIMKPGSNALSLSGTGSPAGTIAYDAAYE